MKKKYKHQTINSFKWFKTVYNLVFIFIFFLIGMFFTFPSSISAKEVNAYLFYGDGCPHCEALEKYLDKNYGNF